MKFSQLDMVMDGRESHTDGGLQTNALIADLPDIICIFSQGSKKGIKFTMGTPSEADIKLLGSFSGSRFFAEDIESVTWDDEINGQQLSPESNKQIRDIIINIIVKQKVMVRTNNGHESVDQNIITLIVSDDVMLSLLEQIENNKGKNSRYTVLDLSQKLSIVNNSDLSDQYNLFNNNKVR